MLYAIGIYTPDTSGSDVLMQKVKYAQQDKGLFSSNQLENVDKILLKSSFYSTMESNKIYKFETADEFNYLYKPRSKEAVLAISSRKNLDPSEKSFLFKNIEHILIRPDSIKVTLDDIIKNPLGFTGNDILIGRVQENLEEVIAVMHDNIDKVILRGENLEILQQKASHLDESAIKFEAQVRKMNSSCCY